MARLTTDTKAQILRCLVEGSSIRSTERMTGAHRDTITKVVVQTGKGCDRLSEEHIRHVECRELQLDEIWGFVGKKRARVQKDDDERKVGDFWTWVAMDPESKLVPAHHVGKRTQPDANALLKVVARRVEGRVQISTDKLAAYKFAIAGQLGKNNVDYGRIVKRFRVEDLGERRYSPPMVVGVDKDKVFGSPDPSRISTSHVERQNLTMRMGMRRLTRLTNGFSKKADNLKAAVSLHFAYYNFVRNHSTIKTTPAIAAGIADRQWRIDDLVEAGEIYGR
jgi:IS1 family transposase